MEKYTFMLNGQIQSFSEGKSLADLITDIRLNQDALIVEHNGNSIVAGQLANILLQPHDKVEIIHFVGGG